MPFRFKEFEIHDDRSTMKVGTDAVLLGAWAGLEGAVNALDVGTGCGIIAIMLAQRSGNLQIDGIDTDPDSILQARENAAATPWHSRLRFIQGPVQDFSPPPDQPYDLIISNPPFFTRSLKSISDRKNRTRHDVSLDHDVLIRNSYRLLKEGGRLSVILPSEAGDIFIEKCSNTGLNLERLCRVYPRTGKQGRRVLIEFGKHTKVNEPAFNALEIMDRSGNYTEEYIKFTRDFYLFI